MRNHGDYVKARLAFDARSRLRARLFRTFLDVFTLAMVSLLAWAVLDYVFYFSSSGRMAGFLFTSSLAVLGLILLGWIKMKGADSKQAALMLEKEKPGHGCVISTSVDYLDRDGSSPTESSLIERLRRQAAQVLIQLEPGPGTKSWNALIPFAAACCVVAGFCFFQPHAATAFKRVLTPFSDRPYTRIQVLPGNVEAPVASDVDIRLLFEGRAPQSVRIEIRRRLDENWESIEMRAVETGFQFEAEAVDENLHYRVVHDGQASKEYLIETYVPPSIAGIRIHAEYPAYTGQPDQVFDAPDISVLRGSELEFNIEASDGVRKAALRLDDGRRMELIRTAEVWSSGDFVLNKDAYYWVELEDAKGRRGGNEKPFQMIALPDERPVVNVPDPGRDIRAKARDVVPIRVEVHDDFGLTEAQMVYKKMGGEEHVVLLKISRDRPREFEAAVNLDVTSLKMKNYEALSYYFSFTDNNSMDGPGASRSPVYFIEVTDKSRTLMMGGNKTVRELNLLYLEKEIIDSILSTEPSDAVGFKTIAAKQANTLEISEIFERSYELAVAPPEAREFFDAAQREMESARGHLARSDRTRALNASELALAHLYQTIRLLPELEAGMCRGEGECIKVVLKAIEELKAKYNGSFKTRLNQILGSARKLAERQERWLNLLAEMLGNPALKQQLIEAVSKGALPVTGAAISKIQADSTSGMPESDGSGELDEERSQELADQQSQMSREAKALAEGLGGMMVRHPKLDPVFVEMAKTTQSRWEQSASSLAHAPGYGANYGRHGLMVLTRMIEGLEALLPDEAGPSRPGTELFPKDYEPLIVEYLKNLSFAESE